MYKQNIAHFFQTQKDNSYYVCKLKEEILYIVFKYIYLFVDPILPAGSFRIR